MTYTEAIAFVENEIRPRYKALNDTQCGDWVSVAQAVETQLARQIVHELVHDPEKGLNLKDFKRLAWKRRPKIERETIEAPAYDACVRCIEAPPEHPDWEDREWFRTEGFMRARCGDKKYVSDYAAEEAGRIQAREGGRWCGVVRCVDSVPYAGLLTRAQRSQAATVHIVNGPEGPGRRFFLRGRCQGFDRQVAALAARIVPPPMFSKRPLFTGNGGPRPFNPANDPELQGDMVREPGQEG